MASGRAIVSLRRTLRGASLEAVKTTFLLLLALFTLHGQAGAEVALYYGSAKDGFIQSGGSASLNPVGVLAVIDLDATTAAARVELYTLTAPSSKAGSAFDYQLGVPYLMTKRSITGPGQVGGTLYTAVGYGSGGGTTATERVALNGPNVLVKMTGKAGSERSLATSLFGQFLTLVSQSPSLDSARGLTVSLSLLVPQTQFENANSHSAIQAKADVEKFYDRIGGHKR